jgi:hypothetical protein
MFSFNLDEFLQVLSQYNLAIWPLQIFAYLLSITLLFLLVKPNRYSQKIVFSILSFFWLFTGIVFCFIYWSPSHFFGYSFGILCTLQGLLFFYSLIKSDIEMDYRHNTFTLIGILLVIYAMIGYQIFGTFLGHSYPTFFALGLVPCPTTIFTFGIFLMINKKVPLKYLIIPFLVAIGGFLAVYEGIFEDIGLIIAGILGTMLIIRREGQEKTTKKIIV